MEDGFVPQCQRGYADLHCYLIFLAAGHSSACMLYVVVIQIGIRQWHRGILSIAA